MALRGEAAPDKEQRVHTHTETRHHIQRNAKLCVCVSVSVSVVCVFVCVWVGVEEARADTGRRRERCGAIVVIDAPRKCAERWTCPSLLQEQE